MQMTPETEQKIGGILKLDGLTHSLRRSNAKLSKLGVVY